MTFPGPARACVRYSRTTVRHQDLVLTHSTAEDRQDTQAQTPAQTRLPVTKARLIGRDLCRTALWAADLAGRSARGSYEWIGN
jgi:hypothetical protein